MDHGGTFMSYCRNLKISGLLHKMGVVKTTVPVPVLSILSRNDLFISYDTSVERSIHFLNVKKMYKGIAAYLDPFRQWGK